MYTVTYTPKPCEGEDAEFEGQVVLMQPTYEQRLEMATDPSLMGFLSEGQKEDDKAMKPEHLRAVIAMAKWSYQFYEKVDLKRKKDGVPFDSLEKMRHDSSCGPILQDVATKLSGGFELGN